MSFAGWGCGEHGWGASNQGAASQARLPWCGRAPRPHVPLAKGHGIAMGVPRGFAFRRRP